MIAAENVLMDGGGLDPAAQFGGHEHIVDSPPDVAGPRVGKMAPPGIMTIARGEQAKRVDEAGVGVILKALALFVGEGVYTVTTKKSSNCDAMTRPSSCVSRCRSSAKVKRRAKSSGNPLTTSIGSVLEKIAVPEYPFFTAEFQYSR